MSTDLAPRHFAIPFRFAGSPEGGKAEVVIADSEDDVVQSVEIILRIERGSVIGIPDLGSPDITFREQPVTTDDVVNIVSSQDPRVDLNILQDENLDPMIAQLQARVSGGESIG